MRIHVSGPHGSGQTARRLPSPCAICAAALAALAAMTLGADLCAQAEPPASRVVSGPVAGTPLHTLRVAEMKANGFRELDLAKQLGTAPCAILFVHEFTRPAAQVVRALDALGAEFAAFGLQTRAVLLSTDRTAGEQWLQRSRRALNLVRPISLSTDGATGPGDYALARNAAITLVVANGAKVVDAIGWTDVGAKDAAYLRSQVERVIPPNWREGDLLAALPDDPAELKQRIATLAAVVRQQQAQIRKLQQRRQNQRMQPRGRANPPTRGKRMDAQPKPKSGPTGTPTRSTAQPTPPKGNRRVGKAPSDPTLRSLLRSFIQQTNDEAKIQQVLGKIEARVGQDTGLRTQAVEMFRLIQGLGYGTDAARAAAARYVETHRKPNRAVDR